MVWCKNIKTPDRCGGNKPQIKHKLLSDREYLLFIDLKTVTGEPDYVFVLRLSSKEE